MRVLHVIPAVASRYGGPSVAVVSMCRALIDAGVDVTLATTDADGRGRLDIGPGVTTWRGVPAVVFPRDFSESFKYSRRLAAWLRTHVREFQAVHIHAVLSHAPLAAAAACRQTGVPYIVRPLGTLAPWSLGRKTLRKRLLLALAAQSALDQAAAIHYTSEEEKRETEEGLGLSRGVVIPLGVEPALIAAPPLAAVERARDHYVLVVSRLHPKKNLEALIRSFLNCRGGVSTWKLVIAGSGDADYVRALEQIVHERGGGDRVQFTGWVEGEQKRQLIRRASLVALPSLHENFGVSVLEALGAGVPALVSRHVHLAGAIERAHAGWIVETTETSLSAALMEAIEHPDECAARGMRARELAKRYEWPRIATDLVRLYEECHRSAPARHAASPQMAAS